MKVKAPGAAIRQPKTPKVLPSGLTDAQTRELDRLMRAAGAKGELWKWTVDPPLEDAVDRYPRVRCEVWRGTKFVSRAVYSNAEVVKLGPMWASAVMDVLQHPWQPEFSEGIK